MELVRVMELCMIQLLIDILAIEHEHLLILQIHQFLKMKQELLLVMVQIGLLLIIINNYFFYFI
jgi:hypothetical protein